MAYTSPYSFLAPSKPPRGASAWYYPRWIAHRGGGLSAPENTLFAIEFAVSQGFRMIECDVRLSSDGVPMLVHDATLMRTHGFMLAVGRASATVLRALGVPTLTEVLTLAEKHTLSINIELKPEPFEAQATAMAVAKTIRHHYLSSESHPPYTLLISSYSAAALKSSLMMLPSIPHALLTDAINSETFDLAEQLPVSFIHVWDAAIEEASMKQLRSAGFPFMVFTVNDPLRAQWLLVHGASAICTDNLGLIACND